MQTHTNPAKTVTIPAWAIAARARNKPAIVANPVNPIIIKPGAKISEAQRLMNAIESSDVIENDNDDLSIDFSYEFDVSDYDAR